jgi:hypothetical protein
VIVTKAKSSAQGGVALVSRSPAACKRESVERHGPTVIGFELVTGNRRYSCVGGYTPPTDVDTVFFIEEAFARLPNGPRLFLGDLNVYSRRLRDDNRARRIANMVTALGLEDLLYHF